MKWIVENYLWVPVVFVYYCFYNWIGWKNNKEHNTQFWTVLMFMCSFIPFWVFVSKHSKRILWDGMLYDLFLFLSFPFMMWILGETTNFTIKEWVGFVVIIIGFLILKIDPKLFGGK